MALIFVGDFDGATLEASLAGHFLIEKPGSPTPQLVFDLPPPRKGNLETMTLTDPEMTETIVTLHFRMDKKPKQNLAGLRNRLIHTLILRMIKSRLKDEETNPEISLSKTSAKITRNGVSSQFFAMSASAKRREDTEKTLEELLASRQGFNREEIAFAKEAFSSAVRYRLQEKDRLESKNFVKIIP